MNSLTLGSRSRLRRAREILLPIGFVAVALGAIEASLRWRGNSDVTPLAIFSALAEKLPLLVEHAVHTATEALQGFALGCAAGIAIGAAMMMSRRVRQALYPNVVAFQLIPKIALAPLFTLWFGVGAPSRIAFTIFLCFFPILVSTVAGLGATPKTALLLIRSLRGSRWQEFVQIRAPYAIPYVMAGMKVSATMAMIGIVLGEFVTAQSGLGYIVLFASSAGETKLMFSALILLGIEGLTLYGLVLGLEYLLCRRFGSPVSAIDGV
jgi:NitT/TauT family transport system permease protein